MPTSNDSANTDVYPSMVDSGGKRWRGLAGSRHVVWLVPAIAFAALAFGLDLGWVIDDHVHRAALTQHPELPELHRTPARLFAFVDGNPGHVEQLVATGTWPWWSAPDLRLAFWRPVSGWTHALDYQLWPDNPWLMHVHSLAWFLLAVALLTVLYRRVMPWPALAGLGALFFALDDSQALPALWLANRNAAIALALGLGALLAHDQWRRKGSRGAAFAGPILLVAAVLANEGAVAIGGYLVAYALFLDPAPTRRSLLALAPSAAAGVLWSLAYKAGGFGTHGSGGYIDPVSETGRFVVVAAERAPTLLWGWWGFPPADLFNILPGANRWPRLLVLCLLLGVLGWCLKPIIQREKVARFFTLGMLLALVPACATFPSNRLLAFVGIGAAGLLALLVHDLASSTARPAARRWCRGALLVALLLVHGVATPLFSRVMVHQMTQFEGTMRKTAASLVRHRTEAPVKAVTIVVTTPSAFVSLGATVAAAVLHDSPRAPTLVLSASIHPTEVRRLDEHTLLIRPRGGFLLPADANNPDGIERPRLDPQKSLLLLDHLFRDLTRQPFQTGDNLQLDGVALTIVETEHGRPTAVSFRFAAPLEDARWQWLAWRDGAYQAFPLPSIGEVVTWPGL